MQVSVQIEYSRTQKLSRSLPTGKLWEISFIILPSLFLPTPSRVTTVLTGSVVTLTLIFLRLPPHEPYDRANPLGQRT